MSWNMEIGESKTDYRAVERERGEWGWESGSAMLGTKQNSFRNWYFTSLRSLISLFLLNFWGFPSHLRLTSSNLNFTMNLIRGTRKAFVSHNWKLLMAHKQQELVSNLQWDYFFTGWAVSLAECPPQGTCGLWSNLIVIIKSLQSFRSGMSRVQIPAAVKVLFCF